MSPVDPADAGEAPASSHAPGARTTIPHQHDEDPDLAPAPTPQALTPEAQRVLESRYGVGSRRRFDRRFAYGIAGALVVAALGFFFFSGWQSASNVSWQDIGFTKPTERTVDVKFEVTAPAESTVSCAVEVLNSAKATIGWKIVEVPPSERHTHTITTTVVVTNTPVAATARECWIAS